MRDASAEVLGIIDELNARFPWMEGFTSIGGDIAGPNASASFRLNEFESAINAAGYEVRDLLRNCENEEISARLAQLYTLLVDGILREAISTRVRTSK